MSSIFCNKKTVSRFLTLIVSLCLFLTSMPEMTMTTMAEEGNYQPKPLKVAIGENVIFDASKEEGERITIPDGASYDVEASQDGINILPKRGTDLGGEDVPVSDKKKMILEPIVAEGEGRVCVYAGLNYTPDGMEEGHIEEVVPVEVYADEETGLSFNGVDGADFSIEWGNFRSYAVLHGGVAARRFSIRDVKELTIGSEDKPVKNAFIALTSPEGDYNSQSCVEFNQADTTIYADNAFENYAQICAWDEADISVSANNVFNNVNRLEVQTGGKFRLNSENPMEIPENIISGYYSEIGQIVTIDSDKRFQDCVNYVKCEKGDFSDKKGRYKYDVNDNATSLHLESTTRTLWALGYSFLEGSGDKFVQNGHFEISAGSGIGIPEDENGGEYFFEEGTEVKFKLVPNTGYKYKQGTFMFNGRASSERIHATDDPGVYIVTMPSNPIHVSCEFIKAEDEIEISDTKFVKDADIAIPNGEINGIAELNVKDTSLATDEAAAFEENAKDSTIGAVLDITVSEMIDQIGTDQVWETAVSDFENPVSISLQLDQEISDKTEYEVIREHNGEITVLPASYDEKTDTLSFESNGFSTYAITYKNPLPPKQEVKEYKNGDIVKDTNKTGDFVITNAASKEVAYNAPTNPSTKKVTIPDSIVVDGKVYNVTAIADNAFKKNKSVTEVKLGKNITTIGKSAFYGATNLKKITLGATVKSIGSNAFNGCKKLKTLTIKCKNLKSGDIAKNAFKGISKTTIIKVPNKKLKAYKKIFKKRGLSSKVKVKGV